MVYDSNGTYVGSYDLPSLIGNTGTVKFGWDRRFSCSWNRRETACSIQANRAMTQAAVSRGPEPPSEGFELIETFPTSAPRSRIGSGGSILKWTPPMALSG